MTLELIIRPEAEAEIKDAFDWYEERVRGLGLEFLLAVDTAFQCMLHNPFQYPFIHKTVRRVLLRRFPYGVFFMTEASRVIVIAVFHATRNPKHWQARA